MDLFCDLPEPETMTDKEDIRDKEVTSSLIESDAKLDGSMKEHVELTPSVPGPEKHVEVTPSVPVPEKQETSCERMRQTGGQETDDDGASASQKRKAVGEESDGAPVKRLAADLYRLRGCCAERRGERDEMQDAHVILDDLSTHFSTLPAKVSRLAFYAVYDGHSGSRASKHAARTLHKHLVNKFPRGEPNNRDKEIKKCLVDTFKSTDDEFLKQASANKPVWKDGSTAICVLVVDNTLYIANLGDSKALLCRCNPETKKPQFLPLSKDHSPTQYEERMRIQKAGGHVRDGRVMGIMEVSRSIGDGRFKHCGVTCVPDIKKCQLGESDRYLLLSCDGLWQGFTSDSALQYINSVLHEEESKQTEGKHKDDMVFEAACNRLASEAIRRGSSDNVTVILVNIQKS